MPTALEIGEEMAKTSEAASPTGLFVYQRCATNNENKIDIKIESPSLSSSLIWGCAAAILVLFYLVIQTQLSVERDTLPAGFLHKIQ